MSESEAPESEAEQSPEVAQPDEVAQPEVADPNLERIQQLRAKYESKEELTEEEEEFLTRMAADPNYPVDLDEDEDEE